MFKFALKILQHLLHLLLVFDLLLWILGVLELCNQRTLLSQIAINHSINRNNSKITIITFNRNKPYRNFCGSPIWQSPDKSFSLTLDDSNNTKLSCFFLSNDIWCHQCEKNISIIAWSKWFLIFTLHLL